MIPKVLFAFLLSFSSLSAVEIQQRLDRLSKPGSALYVAAHPDDENTQLLTYLTHELGARTAYLSLTRGDGGQNLIGSEQSPLMGVIRTHELLEARKRDGALQLFSRARDFGYSKTSEETLAVWGQERTLADAVWAVRKFQPDIIITRFPEQGNTHGHHLASAILARQAFVAAADAMRYPEQLDQVSPWQAKRLLFNVPNRFMPEEERPDDLVVDIGGYDRVSGLSYGEVAALSRSMHKSQGFGAARRFGPEPERFRHVLGERSEHGLFDGVATDWAKMKGGQALSSALQAARRNYRPGDPAAAATHLARALRAASELDDSAHKAWVMQELSSLLIATSGLLLEARADQAAVAPGSELPVKITVLTRNDVAVQWLSLRSGEESTEIGVEARRHTPIERDIVVNLAGDAPLSTLPWLERAPELGRYQGSGDPSTPLPEPSVIVELTLNVAGALLAVRVPVRHYWVDRVIGERHRDVEVLPALSVSPESHALTLPCAPGQTTCQASIRVSVVARAAGRIRVEVPEGFSATPSSLDVSAEGEHVIRVTAQRDGDGAMPRGSLRFAAEGPGPLLAERLMDHFHIPLRTVLLPASVELSVVELTVPSGRIGHIAGPGDEVASGLRRAGFDIVDLDDDTIRHGDLSGFSAILVGVRAFNTREALRKNSDRLYAFAEHGGSVITQYVTKPRNEPMDVPLLPYAMELGAGRVTNERAPVTRLLPDHPILTQPHRINDDDFADWVQERGLYFGQTWDDERVQAPLGLADPGEEPQRGALLVADHGAGRVAYVGLSLFRQIPAGVPGAYRLLANLLTPRVVVSQEPNDEAPPILGQWNRLYLIVGCVLAALIIAFYLLRRRYGT